MSCLHCASRGKRRRLWLTLLLLLLSTTLTPARQRSSSTATRAAVFELRSPDGRNTIAVDAQRGLRWTLTRDARPLLTATADLAIEGRRITGDPVRDATRVEKDATVQPVFYPRRRTVRDRYHELTLTFDRGSSFVIRAYDDGVAYRFVTARDGEVRIDEETLGLEFAGDPLLYAPVADCAKAAKNGTDCFHTSFEEPYTVGAVSALTAHRQVFLPALVDFGAEGPKALIAESDLRDYPGLWLRGGSSGGAALEAIFPAYPTQEKVIGGDYPESVVVRRAPYIARTAGRRAFPWRIVALADRDADMAATDIVYRLGGETEPGDWNWLRPGRSQSEWLWDNILYNVPFVSGWNTETYRHYIDFAARFGTGYLFFDAGWSKVTDPLSITPGLDVPALIREARDRHLGVVLWTSALPMRQQLEPVLDQLQRWGATGVMVDFLDRDDQPTVAFVERVVREAASRHLIVNFHGVFKPTGLERRWPNAVTREAVIASEYDKWSTVLTPEYEVTLPFIRGVVGPIDYEPGHMRNAQKDAFRPMGALPMTQGTRMHQAAMYLLYESPYAKMGGNVSDYEREPDFTAFLASIPTLWTETRALDGRIADYIVLVREAVDGSFWMGAMTDWTPRQLAVPLTFLPAGAFTAEVWADGPNAARYGADWQHTSRSIRSSDTLDVRMAPGGGWIAHIRPGS